MKVLIYGFGWSGKATLELCESMGCDCYVIDDSLDISNFNDTRFITYELLENRVLKGDIFDLYWRYYPNYRSSTREYTSLEEFFKWYPDNKDNLELLHPYNKTIILDKISEYNIQNLDEEILNVAEKFSIYKTK